MHTVLSGPLSCPTGHVIGHRSAADSSITYLPYACDEMTVTVVQVSQSVSSLCDTAIGALDVRALSADGILKSWAHRHAASQAWSMCILEKHLMCSTARLIKGHALSRDCLELRVRRAHPGDLKTCTRSASLLFCANLSHVSGDSSCCRSFAYARSQYRKSLVNMLPRRNAHAV
jgi:hypothetical protein